MNCIIRITRLVLLLTVLPWASSFAQLSIERTISVGQNVLDRGSYVSSFVWANTGIVDITDVNVQLSLSGASGTTMRLGQMYATLTHGTASEGERVAVLLNRPGVTSANAFGSNLGNLNAWFDDSGSAPNVFAITNSSGTYKADGRIGVNPYGTRVAYNTDDITAGLSALNGSWLDSGAWSLLVADAQSGNRAALDSWSLRVLGSAATNGVVDPGAGATISVVGAGTQTFGAAVASSGTGADAVRLTPADGQKIVVSGGLSGGGDFRKQGGGAIRLAGNSANFNGRVVVEEGEVQLASGTALGSAGRLEIAGSNAIVRLVNSAIISNAMVLTNGATARLDGEGKFAGGISGNGRVVKEGASTLTIAGVNTYTGETEVAAGKLVVNGTLASSNVVVRSNSILGGSGTLGALTLEQGATIQPGNSPGTINFTNTQTWNPGASYNWQIYDALGTAGSPEGWSLISITNNGSLNLSSLSSTNRFNLNLWSLSGINPDVNGAPTNFSSAGTYTWRILYAQGGITDWSADKFNINWFATNGTGGFAGVSGGSLFSLAADANNIYLSYGALGAPIPEPGTWAAALLLAGAAGYVQWRRRQSLRQNSAPR